MPDARATCAEIHSLLAPVLALRDPDEVPFDDGLYFFYEAGERSDHGFCGRIVRVGNHPRSPGRLKARLWDHYSPNKNLSVFRKFLGGALLRQTNPKHPCLLRVLSLPVPLAGPRLQKCSRCRPVEDLVTELLRGNFTFRCVAIADRDLRNDLEKKLIGSLSRCPLCQPSPQWLGRYAYSDKVKSSGLWNSNHVGGPDEMSPEDLRMFGQLVSRTLARPPKPGARG